MAYDRINSPRNKEDLLENSKVSKDFESTMGGAMDLDEKEDEIDMKLIRKKTKLLNQRLSFGNNAAIK